MKRILTFALTLTVLHVTLARAAEGRIPIFQPTTITAPGHYVVTRDIAATGSSVITIGASGSPPFKNVTLDLNGHALSTDGNFPVIDINGAFISKGLTIRNGRLMGSGPGSGDGIRASGGDAFQIRIEDLEISNVGNDGLRVDSADYVEVVRCYIHDIGGTGIDGNVLGAGTFTGMFLQNSLEGIRMHGFYLRSLQSGHVSRNVITNFGSVTASFGIGLFPGMAGGSGNQIEGNTISMPAGSQNSLAGIVLDTPQNRVVDNVIRGIPGPGIVMTSDRNRIESNVSSDNIGDGITAHPTSARNHFEANQVQGNAGIGACGLKIYSAGANSFRNNVGGDNAESGSACIAAGNIDLGGNAGL